MAAFTQTSMRRACASPFAIALLTLILWALSLGQARSEESRDVESKYVLNSDYVAGQVCPETCGKDKMTYGGSWHHSTKVVHDMVLPHTTTVYYCRCVKAATK